MQRTRPSATVRHAVAPAHWNRETVSNRACETVVYTESGASEHEGGCVFAPPVELNQQQLYEMRRQGVSAEDAVAAMEVSDGDGEAAMLFVVRAISSGRTAVDLGHTEFVRRMENMGMSRREANAALLGRKGYYREVLLAAMESKLPAWSRSGPSKMCKCIRDDYDESRDGVAAEDVTEGRAVLKRFLASGNGGWVPHVIEITRVENATLHRGFAARCPNELHQSAAVAGSRLMFHGSSAERIDAIVLNGFNTENVWAANDSFGSSGYSLKWGHTVEQQMLAVWTDGGPNAGRPTKCFSVGKVYPAYRITFTTKSYL